MIVIKKAELEDGFIEIENEKHKAIIGKHCIWVPGLQMKIINSFNGKIEPFRDWKKGLNAKEIKSGKFNDNIDWDFESKKSIVSEYILAAELSKKNMMPNIGKTFHIENFISDYPYGYKYCDSKGRYGYYMDNANAQNQGEFNLETMLKTKKMIVPSERVIGDLKKGDNIVNGYLVDVRRTIWDMISLDYSDAWFKKKWKELFELKKNAKKLKSDINALTQFPHKQRKENYQTYFMDGKYQTGSRDTLYRFNTMGIEKDLSGKSVVDFGCNLGSIAMECYNRGARPVIGFDYETDYINCARDLAKHNGMNISCVEFDMKTETPKFDRAIDIVFALSLYKHVKQDLFRILKSFDWKTCYIESNASVDRNTQHAKEIETGIKNTGWKYEFVGMTEDRSPRCVWRIER